MTRRGFIRASSALLAAGLARADDVPPATERIAILSDEVAANYAEAVRLADGFGVRAFELRSLDGPRIPDVTDAALDEVVHVTKERGVTLAGISPGLFKLPVGDAAVEAHLTTRLDACFRVMDRLDTHRMTVFSFMRGDSRDPGAPEEAIEKLRAAADRCRRTGVDMQVENVAGGWADTGGNLSLIARAVGVKVVWDPGNAQAAGGEGFPSGYQAVRDLVGHVHVKDWTREDGWRILGQGTMDWPGQLAALADDGYAGFYCIESHLKEHVVEGARANAEYLRGHLSR